MSSILRRKVSEGSLPKKVAQPTRRVRFSVGSAGTSDTDTDESPGSSPLISRDKIISDFYSRQLTIETEQHINAISLLCCLDKWAMSESDNAMSLKALVLAGWYYILGSRLLLNKFQITENYNDNTKSTNGCYSGSSDDNTPPGTPNYEENNNSEDEPDTSSLGYASLFLSQNATSIYNFLPAQAAGTVLNFASMKCLFQLDDQQLESPRSLDQVAMDELEQYDETLGRVGDYIDTDKWMNSNLTRCMCLKRDDVCSDCESNMAELWCHLECVCDKVEEDDELSDMLERLYDPYDPDTGTIAPEDEIKYKQKMAFLFESNHEALHFAQTLLGIINRVVCVGTGTSRDLVDLWQFNAAIECTNHIVTTLQSALIAQLDTSTGDILSFHGNESGYMSSVFPEDTAASRRKSTVAKPELTDDNEDIRDPENNQKEHIKEHETALLFLDFLDKVQRTADTNNLPVSRGLTELQDAESGLLEASIEDVDYRYSSLLLATFYTMCCDVINEGATLLEDDSDFEGNEIEKESSNDNDDDLPLEDIDHNQGDVNAGDIDTPICRPKNDDPCGETEKAVIAIYVEAIVSSMKEHLTPVLNLVILSIMNKVKKITKLEHVDDYSAMLEAIVATALENVQKQPDTLDDDEEAAIVQASAVIQTNEAKYKEFIDHNALQLGIDHNASGQTLLSDDIDQYGVVKIVHYLHVKFHEWLPMIIEAERKRALVHEAVLSNCDKDSKANAGDYMTSIFNKYEDLELCLANFQEQLDENILLRGLFFIFDTCFNRHLSDKSSDTDSEVFPRHASDLSL